MTKTTKQSVCNSCSSSVVCVYMNGWEGSPNILPRRMQAWTRLWNDLTTTSALVDQGIENPSYLTNARYDEVDPLSRNVLWGGVRGCIRGGKVEQRPCIRRSVGLQQKSHLCRVQPVQIHRGVVKTLHCRCIRLHKIWGLQEKKETSRSVDESVWKMKAAIIWYRSGIDPLINDLIVHSSGFTFKQKLRIHSSEFLAISTVKPSRGFQVFQHLQSVKLSKAGSGPYMPLISPLAR